MKQNNIFWILQYPNNHSLPFRLASFLSCLGINIYCVKYTFSKINPSYLCANCTAIVGCHQGGKCYFCSEKIEKLLFLNFRLKILENEDLGSFWTQLAPGELWKESVLKRFTSSSLFKYTSFLRTNYNKKTSMMRFPKTLKSLPELHSKQEPLIPEAIPSFSYPNINHNIFEMTQINFAQNTLRQHQDSQRIMHLLQMVHLSSLEMLKLNKVHSR